MKIINVLKYRFLNWLLEKILSIDAKREFDIEGKASIIGNYYGVPDYLIKRTRKRQYAMARQVLATVLVDNSLLTLAEIGNYIYGADHSMVIYSHKAIDNLIETDKRFEYKFFNLIGKMNLKYYKYQIR